MEASTSVSALSSSPAGVTGLQDLASAHDSCPSSFDSTCEFSRSFIPDERSRMKGGFRICSPVSGGIDGFMVLAGDWLT